MTICRYSDPYSACAVPRHYPCSPISIFDIRFVAIRCNHCRTGICPMRALPHVLRRNASVASATVVDFRCSSSRQIPPSSTGCHALSTEVHAWPRSCTTFFIFYIVPPRALLSVLLAYTSRSLFLIDLSILGLSGTISTFTVHLVVPKHPILTVRPTAPRMVTDNVG
jgi:hypothetical protein